MRLHVRPGLAMLGGSSLLLTLALLGCGGSDNSNSGLSNGNPNAAPTRAQVQQGRYLVTTIGACADCHSSVGNNPGDPNWLSGYRTGVGPANQPFQIGPFKTYAANLTPDTTTGLGSWTSQQMFDALRLGKDKEGKYLAPPMPWPVLRNMTDDDIWAIVAYLRSLKAVTNAVPASEGPPGAGGTPDWSGSYQNLPALPAYPAANENNVP